jgi:hypothetical protein
VTRCGVPEGSYFIEGVLDDAVRRLKVGLARGK